MVPLLTFILTHAFFAGPPEATLDLRKVDFPARFGKYDGCFVIKEVGTGEMLFFNEAGCKVRRSPCSTFKIFNSLAALDCGVVSGPDARLTWDGTPQSRKACEQDHTLSTAIRDSVVWYFQVLARKIGPQRMQKYLDGCEYSNRDISGGIDRFWLGSSFGVSAIEQVRFMERLYQDKLPFKPEVMKTVRELIVLKRGGPASDAKREDLKKPDAIAIKSEPARVEPDGAWTFSGKTGTGLEGTDKPKLGWFVGHVQSGGRQFVFAANARGEGVMGPDVRDKVFEVLGDLGLVSEPAQSNSASPTQP